MIQISYSLLYPPRVHMSTVFTDKNVIFCPHSDLSLTKPLSPLCNLMTHKLSANNFALHVFVIYKCKLNTLNKFLLRVSYAPQKM